MDWLKQVLPTLATALGGPLAGIAAGFFADKLGLGDKTVEGIQAAISGATPEQLVQMKQIDADLQKYFASLDIQIEQISATDRASARDREVRTGDVWTPRIIAFLVIVGFFSILIGLLFFGVPEKGGDALLVMLGALGAAFTAIIAYYFGSTKGSADKTALIAKAAAGDKHLP